MSVSRSTLRYGLSGRMEKSVGSGCREHPPSEMTRLSHYVVQPKTSPITKRLKLNFDKNGIFSKGIVETSPIGITVVDADGALTFVNERAEKIYGRPREGIGEFTHDDPRWDLVDENGEPLDSGDAPFDRVVAHKEPVHDQTLGLLHPSGDRVWVSVNGAPQWDDAGNLQRAIFAFEDITEQRELETRLAEILGRVTDAFYALDDDFRFTHVNDQAEELLQASADELLGEKLWEQYPEAADIEEVWDAFHTAMETQVPQSYELYYKPLEFRVEATVYPSESGVSVYFRDITDQAAYERDINQQNERLEEFARVVSHDLRNPLNVAQRANDARPRGVRARASRCSSQSA